MTGWPALLGGLGLVAVLFGLLSAGIALFQPVTDLSLTWIGWNLVLGVLLLAASLVFGFDTVAHCADGFLAATLERRGGMREWHMCTWHP